MVASPVGYRSIVGKRLGLLGNGMISVDGKPFKGAVPTLGQDIFIDSVTGADTSDGLTPDRALATLDAGFSSTHVTANKGYQIFCLPNHAETVTGVGGITADIAGISVIGLGHGGQQPRFLMDGAATVTAVVSAADCSFENLRFAAGHADIVRLFNVSAAGFRAHGLTIEENVAGENFLIDFDLTGASANDCDDVVITDNRSLGLDASRTEFIAVVEDVDGMHVQGNIVIQSGSTDGALIKVATGKDLTNVAVLWNFLQHAMTANDLLIDNDTTANTGIVAHNRCRHADVTGAHALIDLDGVGLFDNLSVSTDILSGVLVPAADVNL